MTTNSTVVSVAQLKSALTIREQIERLEGELAEILGSSRVPAMAESFKPRRTMSAASRRLIAEGQKRRWAKVNASSSVIPAKTTRRKMSASARAKIAAAARKRWVAAKAAGKNTL